MAKIHTSIIIDRELWFGWLKFCIDKTGNAKSSSAMIEKAIKNYQEQHS